MNRTRLGSVFFLFAATFACAEDLSLELEKKANEFVLKNAGPEKKWHAVDGAESPLMGYLLADDPAQNLATLARWSTGEDSLKSFDPAKELLIAVRTGDYVENTLHVARITKAKGKIDYVGGIVFVDLTYDIEEGQQPAFEAEALSAWGITWQQLEEGEVDEEDFMDMIVADATVLALEPPPSNLVIKPRKGAKSAYLFDSPSLRGREARLYGGTRVRIVQSERHEGRKWLFIRTEREIRGKILEGWIPASRVGRGKAGATDALGNLGGD